MMKSKTSNRFFKRAFRLLVLVAGFAITAYGTLLVLSLEEIVLGKFSWASRDTSESILCLLIGLALLLYGWLDIDEGEEQ